MSIRRLCVRISNCSRESLYLCVARMIVYKLRSVGNGIGPDTPAPVLLQFLRFYPLIDLKYDVHTLLNGYEFLFCHCFPSFAYFEK